MGSKWESGAVPVRKRGGLGAPCDWMRGDAGCHCVRLSASLVVWARHPGTFGPGAAAATAAPAPRIRRCGGNGGLAPPDPSLRPLGGPSLSESTPWRQQRPRFRNRHRGGNSAPALGVDIVAARGSWPLGSWHSFGSGSFGLDTAMALTPLVRPLGSPALTPLVRRLGSSPSASCPAPLFRRFRLAVRGIAPCDARCWLPDNWASMSLLAVLLKFARYA